MEHSICAERSWKKPFDHHVLMSEYLEKVKENTKKLLKFPWTFFFIFFKPSLLPAHELLSELFLASFSWLTIVDVVECCHTGVVTKQYEYERSGDRLSSWIPPRWMSFSSKIPWLQVRVIELVCLNVLQK